MTRVALSALLLALPIAACGLGPGSAGKEEVVLTVTRDHGHERVVSASERAHESDTVLRILDRHADVDTAYGGRFVQAIDGTAGTGRGLGGARRDWFYFVNGVEASVGAAEYRVHGGDRVWWDYRDWSKAMRVPAVVGSFPEPFAHGFGGERFPVRVECLGEGRACRAVVDRLEDAGVAAGIGPPQEQAANDTLRVLVGPWQRVRTDRAAAQIEDGPARSGVFAGFRSGAGGVSLVALDEHGRPSRTLDKSAGLVAAARLGDQAPTWVVTGTDRSGVRTAVGLLDGRDLRDHYAVAAGSPDTPVPLPAQ